MVHAPNRGTVAQAEGHLVELSAKLLRLPPKPLCHVVHKQVNGPARLPGAEEGGGGHQPDALAEGAVEAVEDAHRPLLKWVGMR
eukprot:scaffold9305_cov91-Isochrysis_galbana.AAC.1